MLKKWPGYLATLESTRGKAHYSLLRCDPRWIVLMEHTAMKPGWRAAPRAVAC